MKKAFLYLFLTNLMLLASTTPVLAEEVNKIPWMIFTYGIPGLAALAIIIPFLQHLIGKD